VYVELPPKIEGRANENPKHQHVAQRDGKKRERRTGTWWRLDLFRPNDSG
jgi:hypothetical protein